MTEAQQNFFFSSNIADQIAEAPAESIVSKTFYDGERLRCILFSFAPGQELSEHTASVPAIIQILKGESRLTLGSEVMEAKAGAWAAMPANLPHSLLAHTAVTMLLIMAR